MRKIEGEELKKIQVEILDVVTEYCKNNNIDYWIDSGTLLGAVRHKGYIPWDDDIDVGMLRKDYDRFIKEFNKTNSRYFCATMENTYNFPLSFAKVMDTETVLYEPDKKMGLKHSINIDIFVYDNAPTDPKELKKMYDNRDRYAVWFSRRILPKLTQGGALKKAAKYVLCTFLRIVPRQFFVDKINKNNKRYKDTETGYIGDFTGFSRMICDKKVFDSFIDLEFEGKLYKAPVGYDEFLTALYGDYMTPPPVEERKTHHIFEAYVKE